MVSHYAIRSLSLVGGLLHALHVPRRNTTASTLSDEVFLGGKKQQQQQHTQKKTHGTLLLRLENFSLLCDIAEKGRGVIWETTSYCM